MVRTVYVNGQFVSEFEARISIFDRGFLFSDSVYEVIAVFEIVEPVSELKMYKYGSVATINLLSYDTTGLEKNKLLVFSSNDCLRFKNQLIFPFSFIE